MKKLLILALASAFVAAANADNPNQFGVASTGLSNAEWKQDNQTVVRAYTGSVIGIDEESSSPLVLSPTTGFAAPDPQVKTVVTVEAQFTAISDYSSLEQLGDDAKTALTVANDGTNGDKYYYWDPASQSDNKWKLLGTTATPDKANPVNITIELDNSTVGATKAKFTIGNAAAVSVDLSSATTLGSLAFAGTGTLTSVDATVTPAYVTTATKKYESVSAALTDNVAVADMTLHKYNGAFGTMPSADDKLYFPESVNGNTASLYCFNKDGDDYQITSAADLKALVDLTAYDNTTRKFKQTANIDMTSAGAFAGIGTDSKQFSGVYDGNDKTISNVTFTPRTYSGVFNSVNNATIKNLTVDTVGFANDADDEYGGAAIVGKIAGTSTLTNLVAKGSVGSLEKPFTHNAAGVAVRVTGGNVTIVDCHNEAAVYGAYSKLAGIINLVQADSGSVVITNCSNSGAITASGTFVNDNKTRNAGDNGVAGILSYANMPVTITDCSNTGALTGPIGDGGAKIGQIVGWVQGKTLTDGGSNCASSAQGMIGHRAGGTVTGFQYATVVNNNVATTIAPPYTLTKGTTYLLEGDVAASATPVFTLAAAGDTIAFDTALGYTFGGTVAAAQGLVAKSSTSGTVTTYTADEGYEVVSTATTTLVAVPAACTADTLIDTSNRAEGDVLKVYSKGDKCYYTWALSKEKTWTPATTYKVSEASATSHSKAASEVALSAGQAVWLTRTDENKEIVLAVVAGDGPMEVAVDNGYNLIAPPPAATAYDAKTSLKVADEGSFDEGDQIVVPTTAAPQSYTRKDGKWKVLSGDATTPSNMPEGWGAVADPDWAEPSKIEIPSGQGFWFYSKQNKQLQF